MTKHESNSLHHHLLVSMPQLEEGPFRRSLIYICEHNEDGAMGIVINHETDVEFSDILPQLNISEDLATNLDQPIYSGGPVSPEHGFVLHTPLPNKEWKSSLTMSDDLCLTTSSDVINDIAHDAGPRLSLIALGYAGWDAGQLEQELADNTWLLCPYDEDIVFNTPPNLRLDVAAQVIGIDINLISTQVGHA